MATTLLMYGESGTGKTSNIGEVADYLFDKYGGITRMVTADSGLGPVEDQIKRGVIQPCRISSSELLLAVIRKLANGFWPMTFHDIETGTFDPLSLQPTPTEVWKGGDGVPGIAGYAWEGLTMTGEAMLNYLVKNQREVGEPLVGKFEEMGVKFANSSRGSYGFTQSQTKGYVTDLSNLPVKLVMVTAHEGKGLDTQKRLIFGPAIVGTAGTDKISQWFQNTLHFESYMVRREIGVGRNKKTLEMPGVRAFFIRHPDPEVPTIFWPAKLGVTPGIFNRVLQRWSDGSIPLLLDENGKYVSGVADLLREIGV